MRKGGHAHLQRPPTCSSGILMVPLGSEAFVFSSCRKPWAPLPGSGVRWEGCQGNFSSQGPFVHLKESYYHRRICECPLPAGVLQGGGTLGNPIPCTPWEKKKKKPAFSQCPLQSKDLQWGYIFKKGLGTRLREHWNPSPDTLASLPLPAV